MVIMLALYSDDPSSNPAEAYSFFCKSVCLKRTKINKIRGRGWPFFKKTYPAGWVNERSASLYVYDKHPRNGAIHIEKS